MTVITNNSITGINSITAQAGTLNFYDTNGGQISIGASITGDVTGNVTGNVTGDITIGAGSTSAPSLSPSGDSNTGVFFPSADTIAFAEGGSEAARIDSSGRMLIGAVTSVTGTNNQYSRLQVVGGASGAAWASMNLCRNENSADISLNELIGEIYFGDKQAGEYAKIKVNADETAGSGDYPGRMEFHTTANGASSPTERMRIAKDGKCTFSPAGSVIGIEVNANGSAQAAVFNNAYTGDSSPTVKITTSGTNGVAPALNVEDNFYVYGGGRVSSLATYNNTTGSAANTHVDSNGIFYRSTSSAKYKTDIETLEDQYADAILGVRPVWYRSTCEADNPDWGLWGFIAEEVAEIDPRLCFLKENEDGSLEPEGVQYDRFVPHLVNLIKRQKERIETLETQNAAILARLDAAGI